MQQKRTYQLILQLFLNRLDSKRISVNSFQNYVYAQQTFLSFGPIQALFISAKMSLITR